MSEALGQGLPIQAQTFPFTLALRIFPRQSSLPIPRSPSSSSLCRFLPPPTCLPACLPACLSACLSLRLSSYPVTISPLCRTSAAGLSERGNTWRRDACPAPSTSHGPSVGAVLWTGLDGVHWTFIACPVGECVCWGHCGVRSAYCAQ